MPHRKWLGAPGRQGQGGKTYRDGVEAKRGNRVATAWGLDGCEWLPVLSVLILSPWGLSRLRFWFACSGCHDFRGASVQWLPRLIDLPGACVNATLALAGRRCLLFHLAHDILPWMSLCSSVSPEALAWLHLVSWCWVSLERGPHPQLSPVWSIYVTSTHWSSFSSGRKGDLFFWAVLFFSQLLSEHHLGPGEMLGAVTWQPGSHGDPASRLGSFNIWNDPLPFSLLRLCTDQLALNLLTSTPGSPNFKRF